MRKRTVWAIALAFAILFGAVEAFNTRNLAQAGMLLWARTLLTPLLIAYAYGFLSPLPWRWTMDDRPRAPLLRGVGQSLVWNAVVISAIVLLDAALRHLGGHEGMRLPQGGSYQPPLLKIWVSNMILGAPLMSIIGAIVAYGELTQEEKEVAEAQLREAQGVLLRGQLSPHVLFNSLNALAELVRRDPLKAEEALLDLAELYRELLVHGDRPRVPLGEERRLVQRYLAVEQVRLGDRLRLHWAWDDAVADLQVPPFLLQPLVENALKHGIAGSPTGGDLCIEAREELHGLRIRVSNTGQSTRLVLGTGIGLKNLEARLQLAYGPHAWFKLATEGPWTVAEIRIQSAELWRNG